MLHWMVLSKLHILSISKSGLYVYHNMVYNPDLLILNIWSLDKTIQCSMKWRFQYYVNFFDNMKTKYYYFELQPEYLFLSSDF